MPSTAKRRRDSQSDHDSGTPGPSASASAAHSRSPSTEPPASDSVVSATLSPARWDDAPAKSRLKGKTPMKKRQKTGPTTSDDDDEPHHGDASSSDDGGPASESEASSLPPRRSRKQAPEFRVIIPSSSAASSSSSRPSVHHSASSTAVTSSSSSTLTRPHAFTRHSMPIARPRKDEEVLKPIPSPPWASDRYSYAPEKYRLTERESRNNERRVDEDVEMRDVNEERPRNRRHDPSLSPTVPRKRPQHPSYLGPHERERHQSHSRSSYSHSRDHSRGGSGSDNPSMNAGPPLVHSPDGFQSNAPLPPAGLTHSHSYGPTTHAQSQGQNTFGQSRAQSAHLEAVEPKVLWQLRVVKHEMGGEQQAM